MWFGKRTEKDFGDEIKSHIRLEADRLIAEGVPASEAEAAAKRAFGNISSARERFYESHRVLWLDQLKQDLSYGLRSFRKTPGFTVAAALTIALGVGASPKKFLDWSICGGSVRVDTASRALRWLPSGLP